jgi:hypothetical protein
MRTLEQINIYNTTDRTNRWTASRHASTFLDKTFFVAARLVAEGVHVMGKDHMWVKSYAGRPWFKREYDKYWLHGAVLDMMFIYKPDNWQQLLLEWPHRSETDPNRIAYTRDERSGEADRQTVTTIGKYLRRHFTHAADDLIRDVSSKYTYGGSIYITGNMEDMIAAANSGPRSCMSGSFGIRCADGVARHPYAVYDPELGWRMAIRKEGDEVLGRCLLWHGECPDSGESIKVFVRSYKREVGERSHSGTDEAIETFLRSHGYDKRVAWPDETPLQLYALYRDSDRYLMPYIDGRTQNVDIDTSDERAYIRMHGDYEADSTAGHVGGQDHTCADCGAGFNDDEGGVTGVHEDNHVCDDCLHNNYTLAYTRRGYTTYIRNDDVVYVGDDYYDVNYLSDNNIVETVDGEYIHSSDATYIESEDAYYEDGDNRICYAEDSQQYELVDNCWKCYETGNWYTDDTDYVEIDGEKYHPDDAPEVEDDEEEADTDTDTGTTN